MNNDDYKINMDLITNAIRMANTLTCQITDAELKIMLDTLDRCDSIGAMVLPTEYKAALQDNRIDKQRAWIKAIQHLRSVSI